MIAEQPEPPPGPPLTISFHIPTYWTPEQAELLHDLRDRMWADYSVHLFKLSREQHLHAQTDRADSKVDDQSFLIQRFCRVLHRRQQKGRRFTRRP
jgi:hypothetical protein